MRKRWACPDLGYAKQSGYELPIPGSTELFPTCPGYSLRTASDELPAEHLIDGVIHPATLVMPRVHEIEAGAISSDKLSPKMAELVNIAFREKAGRRAYEQDEARRKAKVEHGPRR